MKIVTVEIPDRYNNGQINAILVPVNETSIEYKRRSGRIKTFDDACQWCNENGAEYLVEQWDESPAGVPVIDSYFKLRIITAALNERWRPSFKDVEAAAYVYLDVKRNELKVSSFTANLSEPADLLFKTEELAEYAAKQFAGIYVEYFGIEL